MVASNIGIVIPESNQSTLVGIVLISNRWIKTCAKVFKWYPVKLYQLVSQYLSFSDCLYKGPVISARELESLLLNSTLAMWMATQPAYGTLLEFLVHWGNNWSCIYSSTQQQKFQHHQSQQQSCPQSLPCYICGKINHLWSNCRFVESTCHTCGKKGYVAPICKSQHRHRPYKAHYVETEGPHPEMEELHSFAMNHTSRKLGTCAMHTAGRRETDINGDWHRSRNLSYLRNNVQITISRENTNQNFSCCPDIH